MSALETASSASPFDVALVEEKQAEPLFLAAAAPAAGGSGAGASATPKDLPAGSALKGSVDIARIIKDGPNAKAKLDPNEALKPELGPDFDAEDDVPPLM